MVAPSRQRRCLSRLPDATPPAAHTRVTDVGFPSASASARAASTRQSSAARPRRFLFFLVYTPRSTPSTALLASAGAPRPPPVGRLRGGRACAAPPPPFPAIDRQRPPRAVGRPPRDPPDRVDRPTACDDSTGSWAARVRPPRPAKRDRGCTHPPRRAAWLAAAARRRRGRASTAAARPPRPSLRP